MRTLTAIILLAIATNTSQAEIIEISYWKEGNPYPIELKISDTENGLKLMYLRNQETPFSFSSNYRHRSMVGHWNGPDDFYFRFRPRWHEYDWETPALGIATPTFLEMTSQRQSRGFTPSRVEAKRYVPEPSGLILVALGAVLMTVRVRRV